MSSISQGAAPATAGELVQGTLDGKDFLITSPINLFSVAKAILRTTPEITVNPDGDYSKVVKAVQKLLDISGFCHLGVDLQFTSRVPRGKGLASSTSEMLAAMRAVMRATGKTVSPRQLAEIATSVESSDPIFFPGVVRSNPLTGELYDCYGSPPPLHFLLVDTGGEVDTGTYDRERARRHSLKNEEKLRSAVRLIDRGFQKRSPRMVAQGATMSAEIHQGVLFKEPFEDLLKVSQEAGALGVNCAHTGTVLGVMYDARRTSHGMLRDRVQKLVGKSAVFGSYRLIPSDARLS